MKDFGDKLYISHGVVWRTVVNQRGIEFINDSPLCLNETCRMVLQNLADGYFCVKCNKKYQRIKPHSETKRRFKIHGKGFRHLGSQFIPWTYRRQKLSMGLKTKIIGFKQESVKNKAKGWQLFILVNESKVNKKRMIMYKYF